MTRPIAQRIGNSLPAHRPAPPSVVVCFVVPGKPVGKQRARRGGSGHWYTPKETRDYEAKVQAYFLSCLGSQRLWDLPKKAKVKLEVVWSSGDRRRMDGDNVMKGIADGLKGVAYVDDTQIMKFVCRRDQEGPAKAVVTVTYL